MKKVFMSIAIVALMGAAVACGNNTKKAAQESEAAVEVCEEACDSCGKACCDSTVAEVAEAVEAVAE